MRYLLVLLLSIISNLVISQVEFCCENFSIIGNESNNQIYQVQSVDDNYYLVGSSEINGLAHGAIVKVDANKDIEWQYVLDEQSILVDFTTMEGGDLLVIGRTQPVSPPTNNRSILLRISPDGNVVFERTYNNQNREFFGRILTHPAPANPNTPYYIIGTKNSTSSPSTLDDSVLFILDSDGNVDSAVEYDFTNDDQINLGNRPRANGNLLLSGDYFFSGSNRGILIEVDGVGSLVRSLNISEPLKIGDIHETDTGNFILVGVKDPNNPAGSSVLLLTEDWEILDSKDFNPILQQVRRIEKDNSGNYYAGGFLNDGRTAVVKFTEDNNQLEIVSAKVLTDSQPISLFPSIHEDMDGLAIAASQTGFENGFGASDIIFGKIGYDLESDCFDDIDFEFTDVNYTMETPSIFDNIYSTPNPLADIELLPLDFEISVDCAMSMEICDNGVDDDGDGLTDCDDPDLQNDCCCLEVTELDLGVDIEACDGESVQLSSNGEFVSYVWSTGDLTSSITVNESNTYSVTVTDTCANNIVDEIVVEFLESVSESIVVQACEGDTIIVNDTSITESGSYQQNIMSYSGCDSLLIIDVVFLLPTEGDLSFEICDGEVVEVNGETYTMEGTFNQQLTNIEGCDSTLTIILSKINSSNSNLNVEICEGESIEINGEEYSDAGSYNQTLENAEGCDSLLVIEVTVSPSDNIDLETTICLGEPVMIGGQEFDAPGFYTVNLINATGCDSILSITIIDEGCVDCDSFKGELELLIKKSNNDNYSIRLNGNEEEIKSADLDQFVIYLDKNARSLKFKNDFSKSIKNGNFKNLIEMSKTENLKFVSTTDLILRETLEEIKAIRKGASYSIKY